MRILFLSPDFILPANRGLRVRTLAQLRLLASLDEVTRIDFLSLTTTPVSAGAARELEARVPKLSVAPPVERNASIRRSRRTMIRFLQRRLLHCEPYLLAINSLPEMMKLIEQHLAEASYQVIYIGYLGMMGYLPRLRSLAPHARIVLEQHNLEWQIFDRLASEFSAPVRYGVQLEAQALRAAERKALQTVDSVIAISGLDGAEFRKLASIEPVVVAPYVKQSPLKQRDCSAPRLGYVGLLSWQPNALGLNWFCKDVWPRVRAAVPEVSLTIAGPGLPEMGDGKLAIPSEWQQPGITVVGYVNDLEDVYSSVCAMVAPVVGGSGVRMKLLETMSAGMPTVTTSDGSAGLAVEHDRHLLIADDAATFADNVVRLLNDRTLRLRLCQSAYEYLGAHHSEEASKASLRRALGVKA